MFLQSKNTVFKSIEIRNSILNRQTSNVSNVSGESFNCNLADSFLKNDEDTNVYQSRSHMISKTLIERNINPFNFKEKPSTFDQTN